jgi:hypothetical protein
VGRVVGSYLAVAKPDKWSDGSKPSASRTCTRASLA